MKKVPGKVLQMSPWGLSLLSRTVYVFCLRPLTFNILAGLEVELLDLHAVEHLDVAWRSGGEGKMSGEMKKASGKVL